MIEIARFRRMYGEGPLHLIATVASLSFAAFLFLEVLDQPEPQSFLLFFAGAVVAHDLIAFPLYTLLNLIAERGLGAHRGHPLRIATLNHLRVPAAMSALALLIWFPLILRRSDRFQSTTGQSVDVYMGRWLLLTAALFLCSGLIFAIRMRLAARAAAAPSQHP